MSEERRAAPAPSAPQRLDTGMLVLTRPQPTDLPEIAALFGDPRVGEWLGGTIDADAARRAVDAWNAHWDAHGFGMWVAREPGTARIAGRGGPQLSLNDGEPCVELGWVVHPDLWGRGLGTEIGAASMRVMASTFGVREVVAKTVVDNVASLHVMDKLGMLPERELEHRGLLHVLYRGPT